MAMTLGTTIRSRILAGLLPVDRPTKVLSSYGSQRRCDGCGDPILPAQTEFELKYEVTSEIRWSEARLFRLHQGCYGLWDAALRERGA